MKQIINAHEKAGFFAPGHENILIITDLGEGRSSPVRAAYL
ncbi:Uncharacterized protein dnm_028430 [Desulfonema magnum]|uniref:Uncharacterized protein n=1 Tax=Desulfonema magnum TaxID=45655 RepID=A0A975GML4_9BACT|nr:Uncharacterized protein dnm_028430 [Desulfonema magnum]